MQLEAGVLQVMKYFWMGKELCHAKMNMLLSIWKFLLILRLVKKYKIEVLYKNYAGDADIKLLWAPPRPNMTNLL